METDEENDHEIQPESESEFAFESDHIALRGNKDYCALLKHIVTLESKKATVLKDLEDLAAAQNNALENPLQFINDLKSGIITFPPRQTIPKMPNIDWDKYGIDSTLETEEDQHFKVVQDLSSETKVRGRTIPDNKPDSFNQKWSCEEQKRLEELLEIYPEEAVESRRFKKIAEALGTRTLPQVMSRIQKYFAKLAKAGLPIPGRCPKGAFKQSRSSIFHKKSTFFPQLHVPVQMDDPFDGSNIHDVNYPDMKGGNKPILELLKAAKEQRALDERAPVFQTRTTCVGCLKTGFLGARWTDNAGTDYCTDCLVKLLPADKLIPVRDV